MPTNVLQETALAISIQSLFARQCHRSEGQLKASVLKNFERMLLREPRANRTLRHSKANPILACRFFAPSKDTHALDSGFNAYLQDDAALASFAENAAWRLGANRVMIRLES